jgi:UDP-glucose 4-epimerase
VVVTGGAGFIGSHLTDALVGRGDQVLVLDDLSSGRRENLNSAVEFQQLDIRSDAAADLIRTWSPHAVAHLAAQISVSRSVREPEFDASVNILASIKLLEAARAVGARVVFASTGGALYGDAEVVPTSESYPAWPVSPYGTGKLAVEHYLHCYRAQHGLSFAALRYANVYGPRQDPHGEAGVVAIFCRAVLAGRSPTIHGDGTDTRDYVYVGDVVEANLRALDAEEIGHFNVGTGVQTDVNRLFRMIVERSGVDLEAHHGPPRPGDLRASALDCALIASRMAWRPEVSLDRGMSLTVDWFRSEA